mmetsp:Transcript_36621/g.66397  ORF Transcript_36621/g.66397 Transcript_36621/m.66397 type:complete len:178 (+) Transcript_36621:55-588(+)
MRSGATGFAGLSASIEAKWRAAEKKKEEDEKKEEEEREKKRRKMEQEAEVAKQRSQAVFVPTDPTAYADPKAYFAQWQQWQAQLPGSTKAPAGGKGASTVRPLAPVPQAASVRASAGAPAMTATAAPPSTPQQLGSRGKGAKGAAKGQATKGGKPSPADVGPVTGMGLLGGYDSDND